MGYWDADCFAIETNCGLSVQFEDWLWEKRGGGVLICLLRFEIFFPSFGKEALFFLLSYLSKWKMESTTSWVRFSFNDCRPRSNLLLAFSLLIDITREAMFFSGLSFRQHPAKRGKRKLSEKWIQKSLKNTFPLYFISWLASTGTSRLPHPCGLGNRIACAICDFDVCFPWARK
jgi:hypothetical protein